MGWIDSYPLQDQRENGPEADADKDDQGERRGDGDGFREGGSKTDRPGKARDGKDYAQRGRHFEFSDEELAPCALVEGSEGDAANYCTRGKTKQTLMSIKEFTFSKAQIPLCVCISTTARNLEFHDNP